MKSFIGGSLVGLILAASAMSGCAFGGPSGPATDPGHIESRDFAWTGHDRVKLSIPAKLTYVQGAATSLSITAPRNELDNIEVVGGDFRFKRLTRQVKEIAITLTAPEVDQFLISGAGALDIQNYDRPSLAVHVSGAGDAKAAGRTDSLDLAISGAGSEEFGAVATQDAKVRISGMGSVELSPTGEADVAISGAGSVKMFTRPAHLTKRISGAGSITQP